MTDPNQTPVPQSVTELEAQPKKENPFSVALRAKATVEPFKHDTYFATILNAIADVVDSIS